MIPIMDFADTNAVTSVRLSKNDHTYLTPFAVAPNENGYPGVECTIADPANEGAAESGTTKSLLVTLDLTTTKDNLSPVIDLGRSSAIVVRNRINAPSTADIVSGFDSFVILSNSNTMSTDIDDPYKISTAIEATKSAFLKLKVGQRILITSGVAFALQGVGVTTTSIEATVTGISSTGDYILTDVAFGTNTTPATLFTITAYENFIDEHAGVSTSLAKYITKRVSFSNPSAFLNIQFSASVPPTADVEVWVAFVPDGSSYLTRYVKVENVAIAKSVDPSVFDDVDLRVHGAGITDLNKFTGCRVKLVMKSADTSQVPIIKDLRIIATA